MLRWVAHTNTYLFGDAKGWITLRAAMLEFPSKPLFDLSLRPVTCTRITCCLFNQSSNSVFIPACSSSSNFPGGNY